MQISDQDFQKLNQGMREAFDAIKSRLLTVEQQLTRPAPFSSSTADGGSAELAGLIAASDGVKSFVAGNTPVTSLRVPTRLLVKNTIINATGSGQPLVQTERSPRGIAYAPQQRMTIRALFAQLPTSSNLIEVPTEATYTSNAAPQGGSSPIGNGEGEPKSESAMTFTLTQFPVSTIAHFIKASRQILSDAPLLQAHLESRLLYGLALEEESEMLTGDGGAGNLNGINPQASAFTGGATNQTQLDTLAKAANQLSVANYEPSGFILHPTDWLGLKLLKDTQGRYLLGDPQQMAAPMLWGLPVVPTASQTLGRFTVLDARRWGYIADREEAVIRISENVNDDFTRNIITVLAENRVALVAELPAAAVYGLLQTAG